MKFEKNVLNFKILNKKRHKKIISCKTGHNYFCFLVTA